MRVWVSEESGAWRKLNSAREHKRPSSPTQPPRWPMFSSFKEAAEKLADQGAAALQQVEFESLEKAAGDWWLTGAP